MTVKEFKDLPGFKDENVDELKSIGITTLAQLSDAMKDEEGRNNLIKTLSGVGPRTIEKWQAAFSEEEKTKKAKPEEAKTEIVEADEAGESAYVVQPKPEISPETASALAKRKEISGRRPAFVRQEWYRYSKLGTAWRRPKGIHSKMRRRMSRRRPPLVEAGYRGPAEARGLHPSGFEEVMVYNPVDLENIDPTKQAARIGGTVGTKKRLAILDRAKELGIRVLNRVV